MLQKMNAQYLALLSTDMTSQKAVTAMEKLKSTYTRNNLMILNDQLYLPSASRVKHVPQQLTQHTIQPKQYTTQQAQYITQQQAQHTAQQPTQQQPTQPTTHNTQNLTQQRPLPPRIEVQDPYAFDAKHYATLSVPQKKEYLDRVTKAKRARDLQNSEREKKNVMLQKQQKQQELLQQQQQFRLQQQQHLQYQLHQQQTQQQAQNRQLLL